MACPSWILALFMSVVFWAVAYFSNICPLKGSTLFHNRHIEEMAQYCFITDILNKYVAFHLH